MAFALHDLETPIIQAPMAGGISTVALAAAVSEAGGLGFLAGGYRDAEAVATEVSELRAASGRPFGLNLFACPGPAAEVATVRRYAERLGGEGDLGVPRHDDDGLALKLALAAEAAVPVVSFAFGCPTAAQVGALKAAGSSVWVTVTTPAEAEAAVAAGAHALVVQGFEAGGHRGSFNDAAPGDLGLLALLRLVARITDVPLIASGGIFDGGGVAAAVVGGAAAVQLGTVFALCPEAGTAPVHREAIESDGPTALTRAFTGRAARGVVNRFMREHGPAAPSAYPEVHHLTAPMRAAARAAGDADRLHLWAGQAHSAARSVPAGTLVAELAAEAAASLAAAKSISLT